MLSTLFPRLEWQTFCAVLALALLASSASRAQLTVGGNWQWNQGHFDIASLDASHRFGNALVSCDFDGDGYLDLAIGAPGTAFLGVVSRAGAVHIAYGGPDGLQLTGSQTLVQPPTGSDPPESGDRFGSSLAAGDFNGDSWCDLAIGAPNEEVGIADFAGSVHVFSGTPGGLLNSSQVWTEDDPGIPGFSGAFDQFGWSLAAADFNNDGKDDLAIGTPGEANFGGVVYLLFGGTEGLTTASSDRIYPGDPSGSPGIRQDGDAFGRELIVGHFNDDPFPDLSVSAPGERVNTVDGAGSVYVFYPDVFGLLFRRASRFNQPTVGLGMTPREDEAFGSALASGDFDGDGLDDLAVGSLDAIGLPGAEAARAGNVVVLYGSTTGLNSLQSQLWHQDSPGLSDSAEVDDTFGLGLAAGDFDGDGYEDLAIGVPGEDFEGGGRTNNGALHAIYGSDSGLSSEGEQFHGQAGWGAGSTEDEDYFGETLLAGDFDGDHVPSLVVGVPREGVQGNSDAGLIMFITSRSTGLIFADDLETGSTAHWASSSP